MGADCGDEPISAFAQKSMPVALLRMLATQTPTFETCACISRWLVDPSSSAARRGNVVGSLARAHRKLLRRCRIRLMLACVDTALKDRMRLQVQLVSKLSQFGPPHHHSTTIWRGARVGRRFVHRASATGSTHLHLFLPAGEPWLDEHNRTVCRRATGNRLGGPNRCDYRGVRGVWHQRADRQTRPLHRRDGHPVALCPGQGGNESLAGDWVLGRVKG